MEIVQSFNSEEIAELNQDAQEIHASLYPDFFKEYDFDEVNEFYKNIILNPNNYFFIVKDEGYSVGYMWLEIKEYPENAFLKSYRSLYVHHMGVVKSYRNRGIGRYLMEWINSFAKENGIQIIQLDYWSDNEIANRFYMKNGFKSYRNYLFKEVE